MAILHELLVMFGCLKFKRGDQCVLWLMWAKSRETKFGKGFSGVACSFLCWLTRSHAALMQASLMQTVVQVCPLDTWVLFDNSTTVVTSTPSYCHIAMASETVE